MFGRIQRRATVIENYNSQKENEAIEYSQNTTISNNLEEPKAFKETVSSPVELSNTTKDVTKSNDILEYIEANYKDKKIHEQFIFESYPYKYDPEFWYDFLQNDISKTTDYRYIEIAMIQRILEINNNSMDKWFGITNTRLQNVFNIERDFVVQYYALGIVGTILVLAPYFVLLGYFTYTTLRNKFKNLNVVNLLACITIVFLLGISYFSGNLLNSLSFTIYFTLCFYLLIRKNAN